MNQLLLYQLQLHAWPPKCTTVFLSCTYLSWLLPMYLFSNYRAHCTGGFLNELKPLHACKQFRTRRVSFPFRTASSNTVPLCILFFVSHKSVWCSIHAIIWLSQNIHYTCHTILNPAKHETTAKMITVGSQSIWSRIAAHTHTPPPFQLCPNYFSQASIVGTLHCIYIIYIPVIG